MPKKPAGALADNDHVGLGDALEARREVWGLAHDARGLIAHHDHSCRDADPEPLGNTRFQSSNRRDQFKPRPYRLLGVVFVSERIAEVHKDAVTHVLGHVSTKLADGFFCAARICCKDLSQILRVHAGGERRRPDQIGEHHGDLASFSPLERRRSGSSRELRLWGEIRNQTQNSPTVPQ